MNAKKIKAWYFSHTKKLGYGDNRRIVVGRTHGIKFPVLVFNDCSNQSEWLYTPRVCIVGLHGSVKPLNAYGYKYDYHNRIYVWRVELSGMMDIGDDKIAAEKRTYLWGYDATDVIKRFKEICDQKESFVCFEEGWNEFKKQNRRLYRMLMEGRK